MRGVDMTSLGLQYTKHPLFLLRHNRWDVLTFDPFGCCKSLNPSSRRFFLEGNHCKISNHVSDCFNYQVECWCHSEETCLNFIVTHLLWGPHASQCNSIFHNGVGVGLLLAYTLYNSAQCQCNAVIHMMQFSEIQMVNTGIHKPF